MNHQGTKAQKGILVWCLGALVVLSIAQATAHRDVIPKVRAALADLEK